MFFTRIISIFTTVWTVFTVSTVEGQAEDPKTLLIDLAIVLTNVCLIVATVWLIRVTTRDASRQAAQTIEGEQKNVRMLARALRSISRGNNEAKHRNTDA